MERKPLEHVHFVHHNGPGGGNYHAVSYNVDFALPILGYVAVEYVMDGWTVTIWRGELERRSLKAQLQLDGQRSDIFVTVCKANTCPYSYPGELKGKLEADFQRLMTEVYDF